MDPDSSETKICRTCKKEKNLDRFPLSCKHRYCNRCLISAWDDQILVDRNPIIKCQKCEDLVEKAILKQILSDKTYKSYKELKEKKEAKREKNEEIPRKRKQSDEEERENEKKQRNEKKLKKIEEKSEESVRKEKKRKKSENEDQENDDKKERKKEKKRRKSEEEEKEDKNNKKIKKRASEEEEENYEKEKKEKRKEERRKKREDEEIERNQEKNSKNEKIDDYSYNKISKSGKKESKNPKNIEKDEKNSEKPEKIRKTTDKSKEIAEEPISENNCECNKSKKCFTLICGHLSCRYCLHKIIRKKIRKNELVFECSTDQRKIQITGEMMEFIEIKEKYMESFQKLTINEGKNQETPNLFKELSDNSGFLDNLSVRAISEGSEIKLEKGAFEKKSNFNDNKEEIKEAINENTNKDIKCPVCFSFGENTKTGNMIRCTSKSCQNMTIFCFICREVLKISEFNSHYENGSIYLNCKKKVTNLECGLCHEKKSERLEKCPKITNCYNCWTYFCTECKKLIENNELFDHIEEDCSKKQQETPKGFLKIYSFTIFF